MLTLPHTQEEKQDSFEGALKMSSLLPEETASSHSCLSSDVFIRVYSKASRATEKTVLVRGGV